MEEELLKFIQKWNPNVFEVLYFELKQDDDENGFMGEHYSVDVKVQTGVNLMEF